jgi:hypothetical protein
MATFIQGDPGLKLDPVLYTPDYNFLRYVLQKKTSQYEQGLKSVSGTLGALKKELSDPTLMERRDTYMKSAESELQKISSADLSLQQNVNAANAVFDPIINDAAIVYDSYHTANNARQRATMESWASSEDMATRKKFNQEIYDWVKRDLDSLKTGKGDINNYKVQGRKAWAFVDAQDLVNQAAKDMGYKVENDELGKPYIITTVNGKTNRESYELFAKGVLDANPVYKQQLGILGQARVEKDVETMRASNPAYASMSKSQVVQLFSNQAYDKGKDRQKSYLDGLSERISVQQADANAYVTANAAKIKANPQGEEAQTAAKKVADLEMFKTQIKTVQSDYNSTYGSDEQTSKSKKEAFVKNFTDNPEGYYAKQIELEDVVRWSNVRSAFGSRSIKADQGYISMLNAADKAMNTLNNIKDDQFDNQMDIAELGLKMQGKTSTGERKKNADGSDKLSDVEFVDVSSTQVTTTTRVEQLKDRLALSKAAGIQAMTGTFGGLYLLEKMGTKPEDVALVRQLFTKKQSEGSYTPTKEETQAMSRAYQNLFSFAKLNNQDDVLATMRGQVASKTKVSDTDLPSLLRAAAKNYEPKDDYESSAVRQLFEYEKNQAEVKRISGAVNKGIEIVINQIKDKNEFKEILVTEQGKQRLISASDIVKKIPSKAKQDKDWAMDPDVTLTEEDKLNIAEGFLNGSVNVKFRGKNKFGTDTAADIFSTNGTFITYQGRDLYIENAFNIFPTDSSEYQRLIKKINERTPIPEFNAATGGAAAQGSAIFVVRNEQRDKVREVLSSPTQTNSNIKMAVDGTLNAFTDVAASDQAAIRNALADKSNVQEVKIFTTSPMNDGQQVVEVKFAPKKSKEDPNAWAGQTYYFPINVTAKSSELFKLFADVDDLEEFTQYSKDNKPYVMDYHEASGAKAVIMADQPGSKTGTVRLYSKYDPATKQYTDNWIEQPPIPFDLNRVTFNEVKDQVYNNFLTPYMQRRMSYNKQSQTSQTGSGNDLFNQLLKRLNQQ